MSDIVQMLNFKVYSNVFRCQLRVTTYLQNHKTKTNSWDIFQQLWEMHDNQGIISFETQDSSRFLIAISIFTEKITRFLNSGKLVSVSNIRKKYPWEFRQLKIVMLL